MFRSSAVIQYLTNRCLWRIFVNYFTIKPTDALISKFTLVRNSTCFGQFPCPSSGVSYCTFGTGTCYTGLTTASVQDQDGTAGMELQGWNCRDGTAGMELQGRNCRDGTAGMELQGWNCSSILILHASCHQTSITCASVKCTVQNS